MGGKDVALVCADADLERAARGVVWAALAHAGQCGGSGRAGGRRGRGSRSVPGGGMRGCRLAQGGVIRRTRRPRSARSSPRARADRVRELVAEAVEGGATVLRGGGGDGPYVTPVVLTGVRDDMRIAREDVPGPVLIVTEAASEDDAIAEGQPDLARPRGVGLDRGPLQGAADCRRASRRHGVGQRPPRYAGPPGGAVGRRARCRTRACARSDRAANVRRAEGGHLGPAARAGVVVVPLRRRPRPGRPDGRAHALCPRRRPRGRPARGRCAHAASRRPCAQAPFAISVISTL